MTEQVGVGTRLKQAREAAGLAVDEVARQLKLLPRQIESLEHERFDRLPGPTIARGMVRNYARLLKLDPEPLVERVAPGMEKAPERGRIAARDAQRLPFSTASRRSTLLYAGFSVALLAAVGAVAYQWQQGKAAPEVLAPVEPRRPEPPPAAEENPVDKPAAKPADKPAEKPATEPAAEPVEKPAASAEPRPAAAEPVLPPGSHRLVLRMEEEAWLEVRDGAGRSLVSSLNPAGSERAVRGQPPFELVIGNAHNVRLTYDGEAVDLEPHIRGEVARFTLK